MEKERRRKERVAKQKKKLVGYYQKVKEEAEKIQVCVSSVSDDSTMTAVTGVQGTGN
jgi:hypothetical protein